MSDLIFHEYNSNKTFYNEEMNVLYIKKEELYQPTIFEIINEGESVLRFENNGDIFVNGKLIENDKEVVEGFRKFLKKQGMID